MTALRDQDAQRIGIDVEQARQRHRWVQSHPELGQRIAAVFAGRQFAGETDIDRSLYGNFASDADRKRLDDLRAVGAAALTQPLPEFDNPHLVELVQRYVARNYPEAMTPATRAQWQKLVMDRWLTPNEDGLTAQEEFESHVGDALADPEWSPAQGDLACEWQGWLEEQLADCLSEQLA